MRAEARAANRKTDAAFVWFLVLVICFHGIALVGLAQYLMR